MKWFISRILFLLVFVFIFNGCTTTSEISIKNLTQTDFSGLLTYGWLTDTPQIEGRVRTDYINVDSRIRQRVESELNAKGYLKTEEDNPDFFIDYKLNIEDKTKIMELAGTDRSVQEFDKGTLVIYIINPDSKEPLWRGTSIGEIYRYALIENRLRLVENNIIDILSRMPSRN